MTTATYRDGFPSDGHSVKETLRPTSRTHATTSTEATMTSTTTRTTTILPADLTTPALINHLTFVGLMQIKRVDSVELGVTTDPRVRETLGVGDLNRPLARLKGDTVDIDNRPKGAIRGWQTYVYADEPLVVLRSL